MNNRLAEKHLVEKRLEKVIYPNLDKDIYSLKAVDKIEVNGKKVRISLSISNESVFKNIEDQIHDLLSDSFDQIDVRFIANKSQSTSYGNTAKPNNRASYAKHIIAVTSGKGGVGKSTVSVNLSVALAQLGYKVGLLDADVYGPNTPRMLQVQDEKLQWNDEDKMIPSENYGIKVMSVGLTTPSSDTPLVWRSSVAVSALIQFLEDVAWGELDFLVIDMPPGTGDIQLTMAQEVPITAGLIVTTPQMISVDDVSRAIMMFKDIGVHIGGLVENMSHFIAPDTGKEYAVFGEGGGEETAEKYNIPLLGKIPLTMSIREASDQGTPPVAMGSDEEKKYYKTIANNLLAEIGIL
ncbi:MAG: Mrp/NBP35 family ATP-binding protein [Campylobacterota bacterium]|nr:Mrp/NBP35 family ATP-binding protein [Campylobacterota bacterium]